MKYDNENVKRYWLDIEGYDELYQVNQLGEVRSLRFGKEKLLKPRNHIGGYLKFLLCKDGKYKNEYVHRLVAKAFIPNPDNLSQVDHINEDKTDNSVHNLRWVSSSENNQHFHNMRTFEEGKIDKLSFWLSDDTIPTEHDNDWKPYKLDVYKN